MNTLKLQKTVANNAQHCNLVLQSEHNQIPKTQLHKSSTDDNRICLQGTLKSDEHGWEMLVCDS